MANSSCLWCSQPNFMSECLHEFLLYKHHRSSNQAPSWLKSAYSDLLSCSDCVQVYHGLTSQPRMRNDSQHIYLRTVTRIIDHLQVWLKDKTATLNTCQITLKEILSYPRLLLNEKLARMFVQCVTQLLQREGHLGIDEKLPGVYLLLVHPDGRVRTWSTELVKRLGLLDWASYEEISEVIDWLMTVVLFNLFHERPRSAGGMSAWSTEEMVCLPEHLVAYSSPRDFWLGLCTLISVMDAICIRSQLLSSTSNYKQLVDVVLGELDGDNNIIFLPALQIFATLLERLGSRFWQLTSKTSKDVVMKILCHSNFSYELQKWSNVDLEEGNNIVGSETELFLSRVIVFSWMAPFLYSLVDFGDAMENVLLTVINTLCCIISTSLLSCPVFKQSSLIGLVAPPRLRMSVSSFLSLLSARSLSNKCLQVLSQLIELLFMEGRVTVLLSGTKKWLPIITMASMVIISCESGCLVYPSSVDAVRKTVYAVFNNSVGRKCTLYQLIMSHFSHKLSCVIDTHSSLSDVVLQEEIINVLKAIKRNRDKDITHCVSSSSDVTSQVKQEMETVALVETSPLVVKEESSFVEEVREQPMEGLSGESSTLRCSSMEIIPIMNSSSSEVEVSLMESSINESVNEILLSKEPIKQELDTSLIENDDVIILDGDSSDSDSDVQIIAVDPPPRCQATCSTSPSFSDIMNACKGVVTVETDENHRSVQKRKRKGSSSTYSDSDEEETIKCTQYGTLRKRKTKRTPSNVVSQNSSSLQSDESLGRQPSSLLFSKDTSPYLNSPDLSDEEERDTSFWQYSSLLPTISSTLVPKASTIIKEDNKEDNTVKESLISVTSDSETIEECVLQYDTDNSQDGDDDCSSGEIALLKAARDYDKCESVLANKTTLPARDCYDDTSDTLTHSRVRRPLSLKLKHKHNLTFSCERNISSSCLDDKQILTPSTSSDFISCNSEGSYLFNNSHSKTQTEIHVQPSSTSPQPSDTPIDLQPAIYNRLFYMPTCATYNTKLITRIPKQVTPCKVSLKRLSHQSIPSLHARYKEDFFYKVQRVCTRQPLVVSIPLSHLLDQKDNDSDVPLLSEASPDRENSQVAVEHETFVAEREVGALSLGASKQISRVDSTRKHVTKRTLAPLRNSTGVIQRAPFSHSRLPASVLIASSNSTSSLSKPVEALTKTSSVANTYGILPTPMVPHMSKSDRTDKPSVASCQPRTARTVSFNVGKQDVLLASRSVSTDKPPVALCKSRTRSMDASLRHKRKREDLWRHFLSWPPHVFLSPELDSSDNPIRPFLHVSTEASSVPDSFQSYDEYYLTMKPLILQDLCDKIYDAVNEDSIPPVAAEVTSFTASTEFSDFYLMKCHMEITRNNSNEFKAWLCEDYLVLVEFNIDLTHDEAYSESQFGLVTQAAATNQQEIEMQIQLLADTNLKIKHVKLTIVLFMSSFVRSWNSLIGLYRSKLISDILSPRGGVYFCKTAAAVRDDDSFKEGKLLLGQVYNHSQLTAIESAVSLVKEPFCVPRFLLVSGPPGTGKTHTLVGMIQAMLESLKTTRQAVSVLPTSTSSQQHSPHLLVCAPSHVAVDEIILRLIRCGYVGKNSNKGSCSLVRVGYHSHVHKDVMPFLLESLVKAKIQEKGLSNSNNDKELFDRKSKVAALEKLIVEVGHEKYVKEIEHEAVDRFTKKLESLHRTKIDLEAELQPLFEKFLQKQYLSASLRRHILIKADIVCCTLNTCGKSIMNCFKNNPLHFSCIIMDEASRCTEMDTLIPLGFDSSKLVLVGDPAVISLNLKSKYAMKCGLGQSLFQRMLRNFSSHRSDTNPVHSLQTQYRMVPAICHFPSQHFYRGRLITANSLKTSNNEEEEEQLRPFVFFDIVNGSESTCSNGFPCNDEESKFVMELIDCILHHQVLPSQIGVITPSHGQEKLILTSLHKRFQCKKIEVGMVDNFEGREKDVFILSCVATSTPSSFTGFLTDSNKMNVALTRAKRGLYIVGHSSSLKAINKDWVALLQCAYNTSSIVDCSEANEYASYAEYALACHTDLPHYTDTTDGSSQVYKAFALDKDPRLFKYTDTYDDAHSTNSGSSATNSCSNDPVSNAINPGLCTSISIRSEPLSGIPPACSLSTSTSSHDSLNGASTSSRDSLNGINPAIGASTSSLNGINPAIGASTSSCDLLIATSTMYSAAVDASSTDCSNIGGKSIDTNDVIGSMNKSSDNELDRYDHEMVCSWPDSQSIERPNLVNYHELDYKKCFPPLPLQAAAATTTANTAWQAHGGHRKRKAHADDKQIKLIREVFCLKPDQTNKTRR